MKPIKLPPLPESVRVALRAFIAATQPGRAAYGKEAGKLMEAIQRALVRPAAATGGEVTPVCYCTAHDDAHVHLPRSRGGR